MFGGLRGHCGRRRNSGETQLKLEGGSELLLEDGSALLLEDGSELKLQGAIELMLQGDLVPGGKGMRYGTTAEKLHLIEMWADKDGTYRPLEWPEKLMWLNELDRWFSEVHTDYREMNPDAEYLALCPVDKTPLKAAGPKKLARCRFWFCSEVWF